MKNNAPSSGYLLLEALISISLLTLVIVAAAETFSLAHGVQAHGVNQKKIVDCAEKKLVELTTQLAVSDDYCRSFVRWTTTEIPITPRFHHLVITGRLENGAEVTFESSRVIE